MDITTAHLIVLGITAPVILYADHMGFQYLTGRIQTIPARKTEIVHWLVIVGLLLLIVTGVLITIPVWALKFENPVFYVKLAFVATLILNGVFIGKLMKKANTVPYINLSQDEKTFLMVSGGVSACGWITTILIGFFGL